MKAFERFTTEASAFFNGNVMHIVVFALAILGFVAGVIANLRLDNAQEKLARLLNAPFWWLRP